MTTHGVVAQRYRILRPLGEGAAARTFLARDDSRPDSEVAVKLLRQDSTPTVRREFAREFTTLSRLTHPGFPKAFDYGASGDDVYYTREAFAGEDLATFLARPDNNAPQVVLAVIARVCDALNYLRRLSLAPGDLLPANILCRKEEDDIQVKLVDLELAAPSETAVPDARAFGRRLIPLLPPAARDSEHVLDLVQRMASRRPGVRLEDPASVLEAIRRLDPTLIGAEAREGGIFGRDRTLRHLRQLLEAVKEGGAYARVAALRGEPGSGRTTLLDRCRVEAELMGFSVGAAAGTEGLGVPYDLVLKALSGLASPGFPRALLGQRFANAAELRLAACQALLNASERTPLALIFDDFDAADPDSRGWVEHLVEVLSIRWTARVAVIVSSRREALPRQRVIDLPLEPLDREDVTRLVKAWAKTTPSLTLVDKLLEASGGNPGLARDLWENSQSRFEIVEHSLRLREGAALSLPQERCDDIRKRLDLLEPSAREILEILSVATPRGLHVCWIRAAMAPVKVAEVIEDLFDAGWTDLRGDEWRIASPAVRRAVEEGLPAERRRKLHGKIAGALERAAGAMSFERLERMARHYLRSGRFGKAKRWGMKLGEKLLKRLAYLRAAEVFTEIAELGGPEAAHAWEWALHAWHGAGRFDRMVAAAQRRLELDPSPAARAALAAALREHGDFNAARRAYEEALNHPALRPEKRAALLLECAAIYDVHRLPSDERRMIESAQRTGAADPLHLAAAEGRLALAEGQRERAIALLEEALRLARERGDALQEFHALRGLGRVYFHALEDPLRARNAFQKARRIVYRNGLRVLAAQTGGLVASVLDGMGQFAHALHLKRRALDIGIQSGQWMAVSNNAHNLAALAALHGDGGEAEQAAQLCVEFAERTGERYLAARALGILAVAAAQRGLLGQAEQRLNQADIKVKMEPDEVASEVLNRSRSLVLWLAGAWNAGEPLFRRSLQEQLDRHCPVDAAPVLVALAECAARRGSGIDSDVLDRFRRAAIPWRNRFVNGALDLAEGIRHLAAGSAAQAAKLLDRAVSAFRKDAGADFVLAAGLAAARARIEEGSGAAPAFRIYHDALALDRLRFAEEAAELLGAVAARSGDSDGAKRWYQEAARLFEERRAEWFQSPEFAADVARRERELKDKLEGRETASSPGESWARLFQEMDRGFNAGGDLDTVLKHAMDTLVEATGAERGVLLLAENGRLVPRVRRRFSRRGPHDPDLTFSRAVAERVFRTGEMIRAAGAMEDEPIEEGPRARDLGIHSILCLPFRVSGRVIGAVYLDNRYRNGVFETADLERVTIIRDRAAQAIHRARLEEAVKKLRQRNGELERAIRRRVRLPGTERDPGRPRIAASPDIAGQSHVLHASLHESVARTEKEILLAALKSEPTISAAARRIGIVRSQVYRLMARYGIKTQKPRRNGSMNSAGVPSNGDGSLGRGAL